MREQLTRIRDGLIANDAEYCGDPPAWVRQKLVANIDALMSDLDHTNEHQQIQSFALGAIRFVADQAGSECDILVTRLSELVD